ncbi:heme utilization cystosolic carrier protein HutX [Vibrio aphrogenes]|uniref:heme utilization cystosolic carrier protein HutX n=1 Tax=Vibrio aphrogenes TaxID=1891186 RepID=UPI000B350DEF|nr:heme utilization cystosolic carrier protein HutX [Vibrio aphrogenes]
MEKAQLQQKVSQLIESDPNILPSSLAQNFNVSEGEIISVLPKEMVTVISGDHAQSILESIVGWGPVTTIVHSFGSIFEIKAPFPKGKIAHGYYNLMGRSGELHGHLRLDLITHVALVSKPFRGKESYYFGFFDSDGNSIFKIYLGRDEKRVLYADQVEKFQQMKLELTE